MSISQRFSMGDYCRRCPLNIGQRVTVLPDGPRQELKESIGMSSKLIQALRK